MAVECTIGAASLVDVLDRVLDKGIVADTWLHEGGVPLGLVGAQARFIVVAADVHLEHAKAVSTAQSTARPYVESVTPIKVPQGSTGSDGSSGTPAVAGTADLIPRAQPTRHRRPID